jgi:HD-GYP domain-containing protein (c-di-GMP phosphodiesterase class II)
VIAIAVVACAMAIKGWRLTSLALGGLIAVIAGWLVFQVHQAVSYLRRQSTTLRQAARRAERHYVSVLTRIVHFSEACQRYTEGRSERIGRLCEQMGRKLGLSEDRCILLNLAGQLHDIGLLAVPEHVLQKAARLNVEELRSVRRHSEISYEVLRPLEMLAPVLPGIRYHHEHLNGTGYPEGLVGDEIPLEARILAVADAYEGMTHDRPHRPALSPLEAVYELRRCTPDGFDLRCVEAVGEIINLPMLEEAIGAPVAAPRP